MDPAVRRSAARSALEMNDFYRTERSSSLTRSLGGAQVSMLGLEGYGSGSDDDSGGDDGAE